MEEILSSNKNRMDISLRMWSDHVPIAALVKRSKLKLRHCHVLGQPIVIHGQVTSRIAPRHYVSVENLKTDEVSEILTWLDSTAHKINDIGDVLIHANSGKIDIIIWLAIFAEDMNISGLIEKYMQSQIRLLPLKFLIENYVKLDEEGIPRKKWI